MDFELTFHYVLVISDVHPYIKIIISFISHVCTCPLSAYFLHGMFNKTRRDSDEHSWPLVIKDSMCEYKDSANIRTCYGPHIQRQTPTMDTIGPAPRTKRATKLKEKHISSAFAQHGEA